MASSAATATDTDEATEDDAIASDTDEGTDDDTRDTRTGPPPLSKIGTKVSLPQPKSMKPPRGPPVLRKGSNRQSKPPPMDSAAATGAAEGSFEAVTSADPFAGIEAVATAGATSGGDELNDPFAEIAAMALEHHPGAGSDGDPFAELQALVS